MAAILSWGRWVNLFLSGDPYCIPQRAWIWLHEWHQESARPFPGKNDDLLSFAPTGTNFCGIWFLSTELFSGRCIWKCGPVCLWLNVLSARSNGSYAKHSTMLTLNVRGPSYLGLTRSISWLLMSWLLTLPGHQQPWYWLCRICRPWSYLRKDFMYLCHINVE